MRKRLLFPLFAAALLLGLAACTAAPSTPTAVPTRTATLRPSATARPTATVVPTPTVAPHLLIDESDLKGVTLNFWHPFTDDAAVQLREMVNDFNSENTYGIRVEVYPLGAGSALQERMVTELNKDPAEASLPQVVAASNLLLHSWSEALQPLDEYLTHDEWGLGQAELADFEALALAEGRLADQQLSLPLLRSAPLLYLNQSWAEELGFSETPQSFAEFSAIACAAHAALLADKDSANNGTGGWIVNYDENSLLGWLTAFGYAGLQPENGLFRFDDSASEDAFSALLNLNQQGCAWTSRQPTPYDYFATRRAVMFSGSLRDVDTVQRALDLNGSSDAWVVLPYPGEDGPQTVLWESSAVALLQGNPEEQLAGWFFMTWLMESKHIALLSISTHSLPVRRSALPWMQVYLDKYPQWAAVQDWTLPAQSLPLHPNWMSAGNMLEDAGWQLFQPFTTAADIPLILQQLDAMIAEFEIQ